MEDTPPQDPHLFTRRTNPRLTFIMGVVLGISIMTAGGVIFVAYTLGGGNVGTFDIQPLDTSNNILEEPRINVTLNDTQKIVVDDTTHIYGETENYKVTLVSYIDYECRFCKKFFPNIQTFVDNHSDSVRWIVKQYPLTQIHPNAKSAAIAAECAGNQDKFFEYSKALFERQTELSDAVYTEIATAHALDVSVFSACIANGSAVDRVEADTTEALSLGVQTQPNLVVWNGSDSIDIIDGYVDNEYLENSIANQL